MKKLKLIFVLAILANSITHAQNLEFKLDALGLFYSSPSFFGEYLIKDDLSFEVGMQTRYKGSGDVNGVTGHNLYFGGRYYFRPNYGHDKFFIGFYLRGKNEYHFNSGITTFSGGTIFGPGSFIAGGEDFKESGLGVGMIFGRKIVSRAGITVDILAGFGRAYVTRSVLQESNTSGFFFGNNGPRADGFFAINIGYRLGGRIE